MPASCPVEKQPLTRMGSGWNAAGLLETVEIVRREGALDGIVPAAALVQVNDGWETGPMIESALG